MLPSLEEEIKAPSKAWLIITKIYYLLKFSFVKEAFAKKLMNDGMVGYI